MIQDIKKIIAWISWPISYSFLHLILPFVSVRTYYEDKEFRDFKKPLILISNHKQVFDAWYITVGFPFKVFFGSIFPLRPFTSVYFSEKNNFLKFIKHLGVISFIYFIYNTIRVPDTDSFEEKIEPLIKSIKEGESILLFPEGKMSGDESVQEFKKGVVKIHDLTKAPIVPIALRYKTFFPPFYRIYVSIGKPISISNEELKADSQNDYLNTRNYLREKVLSLYKKTYNI